jgi:hypothetical protein
MTTHSSGLVPTHTYIHDYSLLWLDTHTHIYMTTHSSSLIHTHIYINDYSLLEEWVVMCTCVCGFQARGVSSHVHICVYIKPEEGVLIHTHTHIHDYWHLWLGTPTHIYIHGYSLLWLDTHTHTHIYMTAHSSNLSLLFIKVSVSSQESEWSCICVLGLFMLYLCLLFIKVSVSSQESEWLCICVLGYIYNMDNPNTQIHDHSLSWLDTDTLIKRRHRYNMDNPNTQIHDHLYQARKVSGRVFVC